MARPESSNEPESDKAFDPLIALVRLLARQVAAEALGASKAEGASETSLPKEAAQ